MNIYANEAMSKQVDLFLAQQKSNMSNHAYHEALKPSEKIKFPLPNMLPTKFEMGFQIIRLTYCVMASSEL